MGLVLAVVVLLAACGTPESESAPPEPLACYCSTNGADDISGGFCTTCADAPVGAYCYTLACKPAPK